MFDPAWQSVWKTEDERFLVRHMALDDRSIYLSQDSGRILKVEKATGAVVEWKAPDAVPPVHHALKVDERHVYSLEARLTETSREILITRFSRARGEPQRVLKTEGVLGAAALGPRDLYYLDRMDMEEEVMRRVPKGGGAVTTLRLPPMDSYSAALVEGSEVYVVGYALDDNPYRLLRLDGARSRFVEVGKLGGTVMSFDATHMYFVEGLGNVVRAPRGGTVAEVLHEGPRGPEGLVVTDAALYWVSRLDLRTNPRTVVMKLTKSDGVATVLAETAGCFEPEIAADTQFLYWMECDQVRRLPL